MDTSMKNIEHQASLTMERPGSAPLRVFQPHALKEIVEIIDLMGNVASRVREDKSSDLGAGGGTTTSGAAQTGTSARDQAIANVPAPEVMQQKLIAHLEKEIVAIEKQATRIARSRKRGSAYLLSELYRKIRRLTAIIADLLQASAEMIKRFYVSVFIDRQPLVVTGGSLVRSEE